MALAQALLVRPDLLVLDEPWSGLDASAHGVLSELIGETAAQGGAVVFTDHREAIAETHADGVHVISDGRVTSHRGGRAAAVVELVLAVPPAGGRPAEVNWSALPGVEDSAPRDGEVVLRVAREHLDAVLLTALRHRWSVSGLTGTAGEPRHRFDMRRSAP
ncbi:hypothetical protein AB0E03_12880 [Streptomyces fumanus]